MTAPRPGQPRWCEPTATVTAWGQQFEIAI